jgi:hypothetical protein
MPWGLPGEHRSHYVSWERLSFERVKKQKINTRSSTESELVGEDDTMPGVMWTRYFMEAQGHDIEKHILLQDNLSTMLLEINVQQSSSKRTKHIRVRYFFIKDRVANGNLTIKHCPSADMLGDHFQNRSNEHYFGSSEQRFKESLLTLPTLIWSGNVIQKVSSRYKPTGVCWER